MPVTCCFWKYYWSPSEIMIIAGAEERRLCLMSASVCLLARLFKKFWCQGVGPGRVCSGEQLISFCWLFGFRIFFTGFFILTQASDEVWTLAVFCFVTVCESKSVYVLHCCLLAEIVQGLCLQLTFCLCSIKRGFTADWNETCQTSSKSFCCQSLEGYVAW